MSDCPDCSCSDYDKCLRILNLMLDNEVTPAQQEYFYDHIEKCMVCFSHFHVEKQIRQLLKSKINRKPVPESLAEEIRKRIVR